MIALMSVLVWLGIGSAAAQFTIEGQDLDSGGSVGHGGSFSLAAAMGQTTLDLLMGGTFSMQSGEATGAAPFTGQIIPQLMVVNTGPAGVLIGWVPVIPNFVLEFTDTMQRPRWFAYPVSGATNQVLIPSRTRQLYFRMKQVVTGAD